MLTVVFNADESTREVVARDNNTGILVDPTIMVTIVIPELSWSDWLKDNLQQ